MEICLLFLLAILITFIILYITFGKDCLKPILMLLVIAIIISLPILKVIQFILN